MQIMETYLLEGMLLDKTLPLLAHGVRAVGSAIVFADDQARVSKSSAHGRLVHVILGPSLL